MNKKDGKKLISQIEQIISDTNETIYERQDVFENKTERWQDSAVGYKYQEYTEKLETMVQSADELLGTLQDLFEN